MLPDMKGTDILRRIRELRTAHIPVIMVTAMGEEIDRVLGFELGVDDYVVKPFSSRDTVQVGRSFDAIKIHHPMFGCTWVDCRSTQMLSVRSTTVKYANGIGIPDCSIHWSNAGVGFKP